MPKKLQGSEVKQNTVSVIEVWSDADMLRVPTSLNNLWFKILFDNLPNDWGRVNLAQQLDRLRLKF